MHSAAAATATATAALEIFGNIQHYGPVYKDSQTHTAATMASTTLME